MKLNNILAIVGFIAIALIAVFLVLSMRESDKSFNMDEFEKRDKEYKAYIDSMASVIESRLSRIDSIQKSIDSLDLKDDIQKEKIYDTVKNNKMRSDSVFALDDDAGIDYLSKWLNGGISQKDSTFKW